MFSRLLFGGRHHHRSQVHRIPRRPVRDRLLTKHIGNMLAR